MSERKYAMCLLLIISRYVRGIQVVMQNRKKVIRQSEDTGINTVSSWFQRCFSSVLHTECKINLNTDFCAAIRPSTTLVATREL